MPDYAVFGGRLRSSHPIPELREAAADHTPPTWRYEERAGEPPALEGAQLVGEDLVFEGVHARLHRVPAPAPAPGSLRLEFDDTGTFDLANGARDIIFYRKSGCESDVARADLLGRVLPLAAHVEGSLTLHGSAVVLPPARSAVAFLAPKNFGKSTLAMALVERHGALLLTDDTLIVTPETGTAAPGVHSIRLWHDSAARFAQLGPGRLIRSEKHIFEQLPSEALAADAAPLGALYTLVPVAPDSPTAVERVPLDPIAATIAIIQYQKLGALLGGSEAARVFERAATLAGKLPVYRLHVARDIARVNEVAARVAAWHSETSGAAR
ncbi:MAG: hypothetical protein ACT4R6_08210 [Gemmatimonadaceae bacterium]